MKVITTFICAILLFSCNSIHKNSEKIMDKDVFPKGKLIGSNPNFTGNAWLQMFVTATDSLDCTVANVTFEAGVRNSWHSHPGGQILLCTSGKGYYQEKGKDRY